MSNTSKKYFEEKFKDKIWSGFLKEITAARNKNQLIEILSKALTQKELNLLEKRLVVQFLLEGKLSYRKIAEIADVHYNMISFVKGGLKNKIRTPKKYSTLSGRKIKKKEKIFLPPYGKGRWKPYFDATNKNRP